MIPTKLMNKKVAHPLTSSRILIKKGVFLWKKRSILSVIYQNYPD